MPPQQRRQYGVTFLELIAALAILAITLVMGVPSLKEIIASDRLTTQANTLLGALSTARSEAVKRNNLVVLTRASTNWQDGWIIFTDLNSDGIFDTGEPKIQTYGAVNSGYAIKPTGNYTKRVVYRPDGRVNTPGSFDVCSPASDANFRRVVVADTGRTHIATPESLGVSYATACS